MKPETILGFFRSDFSDPTFLITLCRPRSLTATVSVPRPVVRAWWTVLFVLALQISQSAPLINVSPKSQPVFPGEQLILGLSASGTDPLTYQWLKDGTNLVSQTGTNLVIASIQAADVGTYTVLVTNTSGSVTSGAAVLTLISLPFVLPPPSTVVSLGGPPLGGGSPAEDLTNVVAI